jgi:heparanase
MVSYVRRVGAATAAAAVAAAVAVAAAPSSAPVPFTATLSSLSTPSATVSSRFVSMAFGIEQMKGIDPWGFFSPNRTRVALSVLTPSYLRVSGTAVDSLLFEESGACTVSASSEEEGQEGGAATSSCMNATEWMTLLTTATATGLDLVVGLNGRIGKNATSPDAPWDSTNAATFFAWLAGVVEQSGGAIKAPVGYELGNEPDLWHNFFSTPVNGSALAADLQTLVSLIASHPALGTPIIAGPDTCECWHGDTVLHDYANSLLPSSLPNHFITWHFYYGGGVVQPSYFTTPAVADKLASTILATRAKLAGTPAETLPLIIGETGECIMGGCMGPAINSSSTTTAAAALSRSGAGVSGGPPHPYYSPDFIDGFLFLDKLGVAAALNVSAIMREKMLGGNDGFFDVLARPSASYWPMLTHKLLMGPKVLGVVNSTEPGRVLRVYAHCARNVAGGAGGGLVPAYKPGAAVLLFVNFDNTTSYSLTLAAGGGGGVALAPRDEYVFSGSMPAGMPGNDTNCVWGSDGGGGRKPPPYLPSPICLNGALLFMADGPLGPNSTMPQLVPHSVTDPSAPLVIAPVSYGFVVLPEANVPACAEAHGEWEGGGAEEEEEAAEAEEGGKSIPV